MAYIGNGIGRNQVVAGQIAPGAVTYPTLDSTATTPMLAFKNKIINGNFDIWQRGTSLSAAAGNIYLADRWVNNSLGSTIAPSRQAFTLGQTDVPGEPAYFHRSVVATVAGSGNYAALQQRIEGVRTLAGKTAMISFYAKADATKSMTVEVNQFFGAGGTPSEGVYYPLQKVTLTTSWQLFTIPVTLASIAGKTLGTSGNDIVELTFWFDAGSTWSARSLSLGQQSGTFDIAQVQLEAGSVATTFESLPTSVQLDMCRRYYQSIRFFAGTGYAANYLGHSMVVQIMRTNSPTISYTDDIGAVGKITTNGAGNGQSITGGAISYSAPNSIVWDMLYGGATGNWVAGFVKLDCEI